jgi:hypothetical protein
MAEEKLGQGINNKLKSGNTAAARMGPQVGAAAGAADKAAADKAAAVDSTAPPAAAGAAGGGATGGAGAESRQVLTRCAGRLSSIIQEVEGSVDHPDIPARAAAWAHASMYQVSMWV